MAALLVAIAAASAAHASAAGTILALYPTKGLRGDSPTWLAPGDSVRCSRLPLPPAGFGSFKVWWDSREGATLCASLAFFSTPDCAGRPLQELHAGSRPRQGQWIVQAHDLHSSLLASIATSNSVSCQPGALPRFAGVQGSLALATSAQGPSSSGASQGADPANWLTPLNAARNQGAPSAAPLAWDSNLAAMAQRWVTRLGAQQCKDPQVALGKMPNSGVSESDVWISFATEPADAVAAWAPDAGDRTNPRTARILDQNAKNVGCGQYNCGTGAFFTCMFSPINY